MLRHQIVCLALISLFAPVGANAQTSESSTPLEVHVACFKEGIASGEVSLQPGNYLRFTCHGDTAKVFYSLAGKYGDEGSETKTEMGKAIVRAFDAPDQCWHKVENPDGSKADEYGCDLNFHGSSLLRK